MLGLPVKCVRLKGLGVVKGRSLTIFEVRGGIPRFCRKNRLVRELESKFSNKKCDFMILGEDLVFAYDSVEWIATLAA